MRRIGWIIRLLATCAIIPLTHADARLLLVGETSESMPTCEEFFEQWEVPGVPAALLAMGGLGRELFAAQDCIAKKNVPMACKHWQGLLPVMDKLGAPLNESRGDVEKLMAEHKCETAAETGAASPPENAPPSESTPASEPASDAKADPAAPATVPSKPAADAGANPASPTSGAPAGGPPADK